MWPCRRREPWAVVLRYGLLFSLAWFYYANAARVLSTENASTTGYEAELLSFPVACTGDTFSKQSCLFRDVCLQTTDQHSTLVAVLRSSDDPQHVSLLQRHLQSTFEGVYGQFRCMSASNSSNISASNGTSTFNAAAFQTDPDVTVLWRVVGVNQDSYGHALVNEAFSMFLVLQNHFGQHVPEKVQLLAAPWWHPVLQHVLIGGVAGTGQLMADKMKSLPAGVDGLCVKYLLVGTGGYVDVSRKSLANSREPHAHWFAVEPTFFSSINWWNFRRHTLQVHGIPEDQAVVSTAKPLIVLNDKRYGPGASPDRRMIDNIDDIAAQIAFRYPSADVQAVRFRDLSWQQQVQVLSKANVFITTQGSSAFRLVFLPKGATCLMLGAPENGTQEWKGFHELDRWFPLTYVDFVRYEVSVHNPEEYRVHKLPGAWQPGDPVEQYHWWLYNAHVRLNMTRLEPILDRAMRQYAPP